MKITIVMGGSQEDKYVLYLSYWTSFGLGHQKTIGIYSSATNTLEVHHNCSQFLTKMLNVLGKYWTIEERQPHKPIKVEYWV